MSEESDIEIVEYSDGIAAGIAAMFNSWDELWIGGFTQGVPYTEDRVKKIYGKMRAEAILIAVDTQSKHPVGFCSLLQHWVDTEAAFIGLLGVSPEAIGKKVGKRLLLEAMSIAMERGFTRVDLYTWAGNTRAVPLYKKIGFMWNPEAGGVHLEGFIPEILKHPLSEPFFSRYNRPNVWYDLQKRDLAQAPDDVNEDGMLVYNYEFQDGENSLKVTIDRLCKSITGICRTIDGKRLKVQARVKEHLTVCGVPSVYTLQVENETDDDLTIEVELEGFSGLRFGAASKKKIKLAASDSAEWSVPFRLDSTAELFRKELKTPAITTRLNVNGNDFTLATGLKVRPAAEIRTRWGQCVVNPGGQASLPITVVSRFRKPMKGKLRIEKDGVPLEVTPAEVNIEMSPEGLSGVILDVKADESLDVGAHDLWVSMTLNFEDDSGKGVDLTTRKFRVPVYCIEGNRVAVGHDDRLKRVVVVGNKYMASISREGGYVRLSDRQSGGIALTFRMAGEIGPPFGLNPFRDAEREVSVEADNLKTSVSLKAEHPERPLTVEDRIIFRHDSDTVTHEIWATNTGTESHSMQQRMNGGGGGFSFAGSSASIYLPLETGVARAPGTSFMLNYPSISNSPDSFREQWVAIQDEMTTVGQIWSPEGIEEINISSGQINRILYKPVTIEPGESRCVSRVWNILGAPHWRAIRRAWMSLVDGRVMIPSEMSDYIETNDPLSFEAKPIILSNAMEATGKFRIRKIPVPPIPGGLMVEAPDGWLVELKGPDGKSLGDAAPVSGVHEIVVEDELTYSMGLRPVKHIPTGFGIHKGALRFFTATDVVGQFALIQLGDSGKSISIEETEEEGLKVFKVSNGECEFKVSPDYGGCLFSLKNSRSVELLASSFPTPGPKEFLENYFGGVQPLAWDEDMDEDLTKALTNHETMDAKPCEIGGTWKGVELRWKGTIQQTCRGADFRLRYLTAPGSPLILVDWNIRNDTEAPMTFFPSLLVDPVIGSDLKDTILTARWNDKVTTTRPSPVPAVIMPKSNAILLNRGEDGVGILVDSPVNKSFALHLNTMIISGAMDFSTWLKPGEECTVRMCLFVDPPSYDVLEDLQKMLKYLV